MIFKKEVTLPYPILAPFNEDYPLADFYLDVHFQESADQNYYEFEITYLLSSKFLLELINKSYAKIKCIIQSHDSQIYDLDLDTRIIKIPKTNISLKKRTNIQLSIVATELISFANNRDLDTFYSVYRENINVEPNYLLALSNTVNFNGELKRPYELFNYSIDPKLDTEIKFDTSGELIHIIFREKDFLYKQGGKSNALNFHYVYMGLEKALAQFIFENSEGGDGLNLSDVPVDLSNLLQEKLRLFMIGKGIETLSLETLEKTIEEISESILSKHNKAVLRGQRYED